MLRALSDARAPLGVDGSPVGMACLLRSSAGANQQTRGLSPQPHHSIAPPCHAACSNHLLVQLAKLNLCGLTNSFMCKPWGGVWAGQAAAQPGVLAALGSELGPPPAAACRFPAWHRLPAWQPSHENLSNCAPPTSQLLPLPCAADADPQRAQRAHLPLMATTLIQLGAALLPSIIVYRMEAGQRR